MTDGADRLREGSKVKVAAAKADVGQAGADEAAGGQGKGSGSGDGSGQHQHRHRQGAGDAATNAPAACGRRAGRNADAEPKTMNAPARSTFAGRRP